MAELALAVDHDTKRFRLHQQTVSSLKQLVATRGRRGDTTDFTALDDVTFDVRALPTMLVFRDGLLVDRVVGAVPEARLEKLVGPHLH